MDVVREHDAEGRSATSGEPVGWLRQLVRFGLVGVAGGIVDFGSSLLFLLAGVPSWALRTLSYVCGSSVAYLLNRRWTFTSQRGSGEVVRAALTYALTFGIVVAIYVGLKQTLPEAWWRHAVAWVVSQGIGTSCNFVMQRLFVFHR